MKIPTAASLLLLLAVAPHGRELATLPEVLALLDSSAVKYTIKDDKAARFDLRKVDFTRPESNPDWRVVRDSQGNPVLDTFRMPTCSLRDLQVAGVAMEQEEYRGALAAYKKAYACDTSYSKLLTYIGNVHFFVGELDSAKTYLRASIARNPVDYQAHFFLSDVYRHLGDKDKALDEYAEAVYLNRNGSGVRRYGLTLLDEMGLEFDEDMFVFGFDVSGSAKSAVIIALAEMDNLGIASTIAAWSHDPSFAENRTQPGWQAEMYWNAIANQVVYWSTEKKPAKARTERQKTLIRLLENRRLRPAVTWEYFANNEPGAIYLASAETRKAVLSYIRETLIRKKREELIRK